MDRASINRRHSVEFLFPIVLFLVFAITAISVILFAARIYRNEVASAQANYSARTSLEYLVERVHRNDVQGSVSVASFGSGDALVLSDALTDGKYVTYIYYADGALRELYARNDIEADVSAGTRIIDLKDFHAEMAGSHLVRLTCTDIDGQTQTALVALRSGK